MGCGCRSHVDQTAQLLTWVSQASRAMRTASARKMAPRVTNPAAVWATMAHHTYGSTDRVFLCLRELIQNGIDAINRAEILGEKHPHGIRPGTGVIHVTMDQESDGLFTLSVSDNGIGMDLDTLENVFFDIPSSGKKDDNATESNLGGFGYAKAVILGSSQSWTLHTRDILAQGFESVQDGSDGIAYRQGTIITLRGMEADAAYLAGSGHYLSPQMRVQMTLVCCDLRTEKYNQPISVYLNGRMIPPAFPRSGGVRSKKLNSVDFGPALQKTVKVFKDNLHGGEGLIIVRLKGLVQFFARVDKLAELVTLDTVTLISPSEALRRKTSYPYATSRLMFAGRAYEGWDQMVTFLRKDVKTATKEDEFEDIFPEQGSEGRERTDVMTRAYTDLIEDGSIEDLLGAVRATTEEIRQQIKPMMIQTSLKNRRGATDVDVTEITVGIESPIPLSPTGQDDVQKSLTALEGSKWTHIIPMIEGILANYAALAEAAGMTKYSSSDWYNFLIQTVQTGGRFLETESYFNIQDGMTQFGSDLRRTYDRLPADLRRNQEVLQRVAWLISTWESLWASVPSLARVPSEVKFAIEDALGKIRERKKVFNPFGSAALIRISRDYDRDRVKAFKRNAKKYLPGLLLWDKVVRGVAGSVGIPLTFGTGFVLEPDINGQTAQTDNGLFVLINPDFINAWAATYKGKPWALAQAYHALACHELSHVRGERGYPEFEHDESFVSVREDYERRTTYLLPVFALLVSKLYNWPNVFPGSVVAGKGGSPSEQKAHKAGMGALQAEVRRIQAENAVLEKSLAAERQKTANVEAFRRKTVEDLRVVATNLDLSHQALANLRRAARRAILYAHFHNWLGSPAGKAALGGKDGRAALWDAFQPTLGEDPREDKALAALLTKPELDIYPSDDDPVDREVVLPTTTAPAPPAVTRLNFWDTVRGRIPVTPAGSAYDALYRSARDYVRERGTQAYASVYTLVADWSAEHLNRTVDHEQFNKVITEALVNHALLHQGHTEDRASPSRSSQAAWIGVRRLTSQTISCDPGHPTLVRGPVTVVDHTQRRGMTVILTDVSLYRKDSGKVHLEGRGGPRETVHRWTLGRTPVLLLDGQFDLPGGDIDIYLTSRLDIPILADFRAYDPKTGCFDYEDGPDPDPSPGRRTSRRASSRNPIQVQFDPQNGMGAVPDNNNVDYLGFVTWMTPAEFLSLNPSVVGGSTSEKQIASIQQGLDDGLALGPPFLTVDWQGQSDEDGYPTQGDWLVRSHEGRHRMQALIRRGYNGLVPVHIFPRGGLRARHLKAYDFAGRLLSDPRRPVPASVLINRDPDHA